MPFEGAQGWEFFIFIFASNFVSLFTYWGMGLYFDLRYYQKKESALEWKCQPTRWISKSRKWDDFRRGTMNLIIISTMSGVLSFYIKNNGITQVYFDFSDHSILKSMVFGVLYWLIADCGLYWAHRTFHRPKLYKTIHYIHHLSSSPTAYTSIAMHPLEAMVYHLIVTLPLFIIPTHFLIVIVVLMYTNYVGIVDHSGVKNNPLFPWQQPALFHDDHHKYFHLNFGQTIGLWDWIFRTWRRKDRVYGPTHFGGQGTIGNSLSQGELFEYRTRTIGDAFFRLISKKSTDNSL